VPELRRLKLDLRHLGRIEGDLRAVPFLRQHGEGDLAFAPRGGELAPEAEIVAVGVRSRHDLHADRVVRLGVLLAVRSGRRALELHGNARKDRDVHRAERATRAIELDADARTPLPEPLSGGVERAVHRAARAADLAG